MDSSNYKFYPKHGFDSREHLETYFSGKEGMPFTEDAIIFPMVTLQKFFAEGNIKGEVLIDLSNGAFIHHLYAACQNFNHLFVLKFTEKCIMELNKWIDKRTGAFDWDHIEKYAKAAEGHSDQCEGKGMPVKSAITKTVICDLNKENITDPEVLPKADCLISVWLLDLISTNQNEYIENFRKIMSLLGPAGMLIMMGSFNTTYLKVGLDKVHVLKYDENFVKQVLAGEGFIIDHFVVKNRTAESDAIDYTAHFLVMAHRKT